MNTISKAVFMCSICTREQIYTRVQICIPLRRVHMPINCVHTYICLPSNSKPGHQFCEKSLWLTVLNDSNPIRYYYLGSCMYGVCGCNVYIHLYKSQPRKVLYSNNLTRKSWLHLPNQAVLSTHTGCKLISPLKAVAKRYM